MGLFKDVYEKYSQIIKHETRGATVFVYGVAATGLFIAFRQIRPFSRFKRPSDIPEHFIKNHVTLNGQVIGVSNNGTLLVSHKPLVEIGKSSNDKLLPVSLGSVRVSGLGINWLNSIVVGKPIQFVPLIRSSEDIKAIVYLPEIVKSGKYFKVVRSDVAQELVLVGFANVLPIIPPVAKNLHYTKYHSQLAAAYQKYLRKQLGFRYFTEPAARASQRVLVRFWQNIKSKVLLAKVPEIRAVTT